MIIQIVLLAFDKFWMPTAQPEKVQTAIVFTSSLIALLLTVFGLPIYPLLFRISLVTLFIVVLTLALASPIAGICEARLRDRGQEVYANDRILMHIVTSVLGALTAVTFVWTGVSTPGFSEFTLQFEDDAAFNIVLPMTTIIVFAYIRWQQLNECPGLDEMVKEGKDCSDCIIGFSLKHVHELFLAIYLIIVTFIGAGMVLYLFAFTLNQAKLNKPIDLDWRLATAVVLLLLFLFACGLPRMRKHQAVYLTFLTGTPAALMISIVWLALMNPTAFRNWFALGVIILGYVVYTAEAILGSRRDSKDAIQLHYFSAAMFAVALTLLIGALYLSQPVGP